MRDTLRKWRREYGPKVAQGLSQAKVALKNPKTYTKAAVDGAVFTTRFSNGFGFTASALAAFAMEGYDAGRQPRENDPLIHDLTGQKAQLVAERQLSAEEMAELNKISAPEGVTIVLPEKAEKDDSRDI